MDLERTRRAVLAAALGGGVGWLAQSSVSSFPARFAPLSGEAWKAADNRVPGSVESPYGDAEVNYDEYGVPHVSATDEQALSFAVGYVQAADRLFQMDVIRRQMAGKAAEAVGEVAVESDTFYRKLQFERAAETTWTALEGTPAGDAVEAFADGVEAYRAENDLPLEFRLLGYEPLEWTPVDTMLMEKRISWGLTGSFRTLRRAAVREAFDRETVERLYPQTLDHDSPILRDGSDASGDPVAPTDASRGTDAAVPDPELVGWLSGFEWPDGVGSNHWAVGPEHTPSGKPILAYDPHLQLTAPPVWYEQRTTLEGEYDARGATFPGVPVLITGENEHGAWGFTNGGADVIDFYAYERDEGETYVYGDELREFDTRTETVAVADGDDVEVTVRTGVHGPVLGVGSDGDPLPSLEDDRALGVAWTGFAPTRTTEAVYDLVRSTGAGEAREAIRKFDEPTQNLLYVDDENLLYYLTGAIPVRRTDGEAVPGTRVFDGSAREGEWAGYEPFGDTDWEGEGFVPFEAKPHVLNPDAGYLGTANQRIVDDPEYYLSEGYAPPFRGARIYERLDSRVDADEPMDAEFMTDVQQDVYDRRADLFVPILDAHRDRLSGEAASAADELLAWDREMRADSYPALVFRYWLEAFREATFEDDFEAAGIGDVGYPNEFVLGNLPPDSRWFAPAGETAGDRGNVVATAMETALERIDEAGHETYGDYNRTDVDHPFDQSFLNYPKLPTDGSPGTVRNFRKDSQAGSSWRMVCSRGGDSKAIVPGGNSGDYFSEHYDDQLERWANEGYKPLVRSDPSDPETTVTFRGEDG
jgi:penicillin amidase